jgi:hypothetical protein
MSFSATSSAVPSGLGWTSPQRVWTAKASL